LRVRAAADEQTARQNSVRKSAKFGHRFLGREATADVPSSFATAVRFVASLVMALLRL
jgi:hypothetical protein